MCNKMYENVKSLDYTKKFLQKDSNPTTMEVVTQTNAVKFEKRNREPWVRRLREMPFQKQLERHFLSFDIRHLLSPKLLPDGTELIRYIRIGHCTGDIHCPSGFGGFIEPAFILHGLQRVL